MNGNNSNCVNGRTEPVIAVIGGTGLENPELLKEREELATQKTPWGEASTICTGLLGGQTRIYILSRHGKLHDKSPTQGYNCLTVVSCKLEFSQLQREFMGSKTTRSDARFGHYG